MNISEFNLFKDQKERFKKALGDYDPHVWFPPLRGGFEANNPGNWFICFVPESWGRWAGASYGVHFDFKYYRRPDEQMRLVVGVENPMKASRRQAFKEDVISRVRAKRISFSGFVLRAEVNTKLLEADSIPFNDQSWQVAIQQYIALQPLVEIIAVVVRECYKDGAFDVLMDFP